MYEVTNIPEAELNSKMQNPTKVDRDGQSWFGWISSDMRGLSALKYWKTDNGMESERESAVSSESLKPADDDGPMTISKDAAPVRFFNSPKESLKAAIIRQGKKWHARLSFLLRLAKKILGGLWDIDGTNLSFNTPKCLKILHLGVLNSDAGDKFLFNRIRCKLGDACRLRSWRDIEVEATILFSFDSKKACGVSEIFRSSLNVASEIFAS